MENEVNIGIAEKINYEKPKFEEMQGLSFTKETGINLMVAGSVFSAAVVTDVGNYD